MKIEFENSIKKLSFLSRLLDIKIVFMQIYLNAKQLILAIYQNLFIILDRSVNFWQKGQKNNGIILELWLWSKTNIANKSDRTLIKSNTLKILLDKGCTTTTSFPVHTRRLIDVETTSCVYWVPTKSKSFLNAILDKVNAIE